MPGRPPNNRSSCPEKFDAFRLLSFPPGGRTASEVAKRQAKRRSCLPKFSFQALRWVLAGQESLAKVPESYGVHTDSVG